MQVPISKRWLWRRASAAHERFWRNGNDIAKDRNDAIRLCKKGDCSWPEELVESQETQNEKCNGDIYRRVTADQKNCQKHEYQANTGRYESSSVMPTKQRYSQADATQGRYQPQGGIKQKGLVVPTNQPVTRFVQAHPEKKHSPNDHRERDSNHAKRTRRIHVVR